MPSPFPGMDPYLERPDHWSGVHAGPIAVLREMLARKVAPRFFVDSEDHVYILGLGDPGSSFVRPDLLVVETEDARAMAATSGAIATPLVFDMPATVEVRQPYLTLVDTLDRHVVTTIEVLSPINKTPGSRGQRDFLHKRKQVFASSTHWLEIDLLRAGSRSPYVTERGDYAAAMHRAEFPEQLYAWFASVREPLPTIAVPLRRLPDDVPLYLQDVVDTVYDRYRYDTVIDYDSVPPAPPLSADDAAWARDRIASWRREQGE